MSTTMMVVVGAIALILIALVNYGSGKVARKEEAERVERERLIRERAEARLHEIEREERAHAAFVAEREAKKLELETLKIQARVKILSEGENNNVLHTSYQEDAFGINIKRDYLTIGRADAGKIAMKATEMCKTVSVDDGAIEIGPGRDTLTGMALVKLAENAGNGDVAAAFGQIAKLKASAPSPSDTVLKAVEAELERVRAESGAGLKKAAEEKAAAEKAKADAEEHNKRVEAEIARLKKELEAAKKKTP